MIIYKKYQNKNLLKLYCITIKERRRHFRLLQMFKSQNAKFCLQALLVIQRINKKIF